MRTEGDLIKINEWLLPLSWLYGLGVRFRNWLFDVGIKKSQAFDIPVISVGNITVGGSGKTPHVEYLVRLLKDKARVAVLSRGYKRKGKGFILADENTTMEEIGDEPFQMHRKFPDVAVAVEKKRVKGIELLQENPATKDVEVIVLDDAFQHRHVKPGINILLVDYHRLFIYDKLLPAGRLREPVSGKRRADIVIVTKCPKDLKPMEYRVLTKALDLFPYQGLYFTTINYRAPQYVFGGGRAERPPCTAIGGHRLAQAHGERPGGEIRLHANPGLPRPSHVQAQRHRPYQRGLQRPAPPPRHHHHGERRRAAESRGRNGRGNESPSAGAAHPGGLHARARKHVQRKDHDHKLCTKKFKRQHPG